MNSFTAYDGVERVISKGDTRSSIVLRSGLQVDLRVVPQESYGTALHYFTGSQAHNIAIRRIGQQKGLKINEYGVFSGSRRTGGQTERILRAMDNPHFNILGHPTGRLLNQRPAYAVDLERLITAAAERGCFLELNAHPDRLDLDDVHCRLAKETGVKVAISTDAHSIDHLDYMRLGVAQARRGWLEPSDVLSTHSLAQLQKLFRRS